MATEVSSGLTLVAGAWYGDTPLALDVPERWLVTKHGPEAWPPLSDRELASALERPVGQPPIRELARGKQRPVIIVDDLTRPTPADRVLPLILAQLDDAGVERQRVTIIVGSGTHAPPDRAQMLKKVGPEAAECRLLAHDDRKNLVRIGRTTYGSPIIVNREVAKADFLIGVGGAYPQHSVGFGGGSKLLLGVLGRRSIIHLHYGHASVAGSYNIDNDFRKDLDEMARVAGFGTMVTLHVNEKRHVIRIVSGDHFAYHRDAVEFSRMAYKAPPPGDADVVVANAYPMDVSLTFTRSKGMAPLFHCAPKASRVLISACSEGIGHHGLFPFMNGPRYEKQLHLMRRLQAVGPTALPGKVARRLLSKARDRRPRQAAAPEQTKAVAVPRNPIWLYTPGLRGVSLPDLIPGMRHAPSWEAVVRAVDLEQKKESSLDVVVYTCAPLQCLDLAAGGAFDHLASAG